MKKLTSILIGIAMAVAGVVGFYFLIKNNALELTISMDSVSVKVGERSKVVYECNMKDATLVFEIEDTTIASVEKIGTSYYVNGIKKGKTEISLKASYGKYNNYCTKNVYVIEEGEVAPIEFEIESIDECDVDNEEKAIVMVAGTPATFSITSTSAISSTGIICEDPRVTIEKKTSPNNSFKIICNIKGTYTLAVSVNGQTQNYKLYVQDDEE